MRVRARGGVAAAGAALALAAMAGVAYAEGNFSWYTQSVSKGFNSRTWTKNSSLGATVINEYSCQFNYPSGGSFVTYQLTREQPWYKPDQDLGHLQSPCFSNGWSGNSYRNFGAPGPSNYHFTYIDTDNPNQYMNATGAVAY